MEPHVLLVDDDIDLCRMAALGLAQRQFEVQWLTSGKAAASAICEQDFDVLVADVIMEDMDGLHLCKHVADRCPHLPVVLMTAHGSLELAIHALRAGAHDLLTKPFGLEELVQAIRRVTRERQQARLALASAAQQQPTSCGCLSGDNRVMLKLTQLLTQLSAAEAPLQITGKSKPAFPSLEDLELSYIQQVLSSLKGNKSLAAKLLGIDRATLYRKLARASRPREEQR